MCFMCIIEAISSYHKHKKDILIELIVALIELNSAPKTPSVHKSKQETQGPHHSPEQQ